MIHISLAAEPLFNLGGLTVTNSLLTSVISSAAIMLLFWLGGRELRLYPKSRLSQSIESIIEALLGLIENVTRDRATAKRWLPLLATLFLFILFNNWIGLVPGVGAIVLHNTDGTTVAVFRGANADLNTTLALAFISVVMTQLYAIRSLGLFRHLGKYVSLNPMMLFIGFIELISEASRMISFSFRLFGNIFAGEVLLAVIAYLLPLVGPLPFLLFELFIGLIQALVFTMLTLAFLDTATTSHDAHASGQSQTHSPHKTKLASS